MTSRAGSAETGSAPRPSAAPAAAALAATLCALAVVLGGAEPASAQAPEASATGPASPTSTEPAGGEGGEGGADTGVEIPPGTEQERLFAIIDDLHAVQPEDPRGALAALETLKRTQSFNAHFQGALARAYAIRASFDGDPIWARRALEEGRRAVQNNDNLVITHAGHGWGLLASTRFGDPKPEARAAALDKAAEVFARAAERAGDAAWVDHCFRGEALADARRYADAEAAYKAAAVSNRLAWEPLEGEARLRFAQGRLADAAERFEAAAARALDTVAYLRSDAARKEAEDVLKELSDHQRVYRTRALVRGAPEAQRLYVEAAEMRFALGQADAATALLAKAEAARPEELPASGRLLRARVELKRGRAAEALAALGEPTAAAPALELAVRGEALRAAGKAEAAKAQLEAAYKSVIAPGLAVAGLAELELAGGRAQDAARLAAEAVARDRHVPERFELLARARAALKDEPGQQAALARAATLTTQIEAARAEGTDIEPRLRKMAAARMLAAHRYLDALEAIEPLADGQDLRAGLIHASALAGLGREQALDVAARALPLAPGALDVQVVMARAAFAAGRAGQAQEHALRALALAPKSPDVRALLTLVNTAGVRSPASAQVEEQVARLSAAERAERRRLIDQHLAQRNTTALVLHLPNEDDDELLAVVITGIGGATQPEVRRSLETRALTIGPEQPRAQVAAVATLKAWGSPTSVQGLAAIAARPANPEIGTEAKQAVGELTAKLELEKLAALLDPTADHHRVIQEAHDVQQEKLVETDYLGLGMKILRYASIAGIALFATLALMQRRKARQDAEARAARRKPV